MKITEIKVHLKDTRDSKLKAFVTVTFDDMFVVHDMKVIEGKKGLFVAMPSVKMKEPCPKCDKRIPVRSKFCPECGSKLPETPSGYAEGEEEREEHKDIAHPITAEARDYIRAEVLKAYEEEKQLV